MKKLAILFFLITIVGSVFGQTRLPFTNNQSSAYFMPTSNDLIVGLQYSPQWVSFKNHTSTSSMYAVAPVGKSFFIQPVFNVTKFSSDDLYDFQLNLIYKVKLGNSSLMLNVGPGVELLQENSRVNSRNLNDPTLQYRSVSSIYSLAGISFLNPYFFVSVQNIKGVDFDLTNSDLAYLGELKTHLGWIFTMADGTFVVMPSVEADIDSDMIEDMKINLGISYQNQVINLGYGLNGEYFALVDIYLSKYLSVGFGYKHFIVPSTGATIITLRGTVPTSKIKK